MGSEAWGEKIPGGYFHEQFHVYRGDDGVIVPSTTQVFDVLGMSDFSMVDPSVLEWKRNFGTGLHRALELLVFDRLDWDSLDDILIEPTVGLETWLKVVKYKAEAAEERCICTINGMRVGQTLDHRGRLIFKGQERPAIIDLKSGSKYSPTWSWQLGSYYGGAPKPASSGYVGVILQADMEGKIKPYWIDLAKALREFTILLCAANLKLNNGMAQLRGAA
jgi:hypothetical protein